MLRPAALQIFAVCMALLTILRPVSSFVRPYVSKNSIIREWSTTTLQMVRSRGLEVRREGATPQGEEGFKYVVICGFRATVCEITMTLFAFY